MSISVDIFGDPRKGNVSDLSKTAKHGSYAYFPGTGPNKRCAACEFFIGGGVDPDNITKKGNCAKFRELTGNKGNQIPRSAKACKYFETRVREVPKNSQYKPLK